MRKFAGEWVSAVLTRLGMQEGEAIESRMVSRRIEGAQKKVEERNFDIRKNLLEYDEVMDEQRKRVYSFRQGLLEGAPPKEMILEMIDSQIGDAAKRFLADDYGAASFAEWVGQRLGVELAARDFKGASFEDAEEIAQHQGRAPAPRDDPPGHGGKPPRRRRSLGMDLAGPGELGQRPLRAQPQGKGPQEIRPSPTATSSSSAARTSRSSSTRKPSTRSRSSTSSPAREFLLPDWGRRSLAGWVHHKFALAVDPGDLGRARPGRDRPPHPGRGPQPLRPEGSRAARADRLDQYLGDRVAAPDPRYDREGLAAWARERYHVVIDAEELRPLLRPEIEALLDRAGPPALPGSRLAAGARRQARGRRRLQSRLRRQGRDRPPIPRPWPSWPPGHSKPSGSRSAADELAAMTPPRSAARSSTPSTPSTGPRCARWKKPSCSRSSIRAGWNTCGPWTTSAARSACKAMPRSIPRSSTSGKA